MAGSLAALSGKVRNESLTRQRPFCQICPLARKILRFARYQPYKNPNLRVWITAARKKSKFSLVLKIITDFFVIHDFLGRCSNATVGDFQRALDESHCTNL
jgi:hypothetical protein